MVIADTSVWIPFFNRPNSLEKRALDLLIDAHEVALVGVILTEILQGCRSRSERDEVTDALLALPYLEARQSTWILAGDLSSTLLQTGVTLPISDLVVAALALEHHCSVYSLDSHFQQMPGLRRYTPASG